jgi:hypothetical protein
MYQNRQLIRLEILLIIFLIDESENAKRKIYAIVFSPPIWLNKNNWVYTYVVRHAEKANAQIGTFGFAAPQAKRKKPKEPIFLPTLGQKTK